MTDEAGKETMEVRCPQCKKTVKVSVAAVEEGKPVKCPNGHEIPMAKALF
jgi:hypothetical protein